MRAGFRVAIFVAAFCLLPLTALAQGSITGVVRDPSGAVLPGVTVEASSPALIEKVRTTTTDSSGAYRIEDLRPGTYIVTFTLSGFSTVRRQDIVLTGSFAASVNADLKVGSLTDSLLVAPSPVPSEEGWEGAGWNSRSESCSLMKTPNWEEPAGGAW